MFGETAAVWVGDDRPRKRVVSINEGSAKSAQDQQAPKVLVVDDETLIADTVVTILKRSGFRAYAAYDGQRALEIAKKVKPDFVLADVLMPSMNGVEVAIALREMKLNAKIFLFSGQAGISGILADAEKRGYEFDLIPKPIHPDKLVQFLKKR
jgi:CheY-like chemotaxis protein